MKRINSILLMVVAAVLFLTGCTGALPANNWPGIVTDKNTAYLAYSTGVFAVDLKDGSYRWRYPEKPDAAVSFFATPALSEDGLLIIGDYSHKLSAVDIKNGIEKWSFADAGGRYIGGPLIVKNVIVAPNADRNVYGLDLTGKLLWKYQGENGFWSKPVSDGETAYIGGMDHTLYALKVTNGSVSWYKKLSGAILHSPALSKDGVLYVGTIAGDLYAIDSKTGKEIWKASSGKAVWGSPLVKDDTIFYAIQDGGIFTSSVKDGVTTKIGMADSLVIAGPALVGEQIVVLAESGQVLSFNSKGEKLSTRTITGKLYTAPVVEGDRMLVGLTGSDKPLASFDLNGAEQWSFTMPK